MSDLEKNKIDVILPVYNEEKYVLDALDSVVAQTLRPNKIIVIDDGSFDNTNKVVKEYAKKIEMPIIVLRKENGGISSARNLGIKNSHAEFLAFIDSDDTWEQNKLETQFLAFNNSAYPNLGLVYADYDHINPAGKKMSAGKVKFDPRFRGQIFKSLLGANKILGSASSVFIKREVFDRVGLFDENLKFAEDWDMWLRISQKYDVDFVDQVLVHIRKHPENRTSYYEKNFEGELSFYNKWGLLLGDDLAPKEWRERILGQLVRKFWLEKLTVILDKKMLPEVRKKIFPNGIDTIMLIKFIMGKLTSRFTKNEK